MEPVGVVGLAVAGERARWPSSDSTAPWIAAATAAACLSLNFAVSMRTTKSLMMSSVRLSAMRVGSCLMILKRPAEGFRTTLADLPPNPLLRSRADGIDVFEGRGLRHRGSRLAGAIT